MGSNSAQKRTANAQADLATAQAQMGQLSAESQKKLLPYQERLYKLQLGNLETLNPTEYDLAKRSLGLEQGEMGAYEQAAPYKTGTIVKQAQQEGRQTDLSGRTLGLQEGQMGAYETASPIYNALIQTQAEQTKKQAGLTGSELAAYESIAPIQQQMLQSKYGLADKLIGSMPEYKQIGLDSPETQQIYNILNEQADFTEKDLKKQNSNASAGRGDFGNSYRASQEASIADKMARLRTENKTNALDIATKLYNQDLTNAQSLFNFYTNPSYYQPGYNNAYQLPTYSANVAQSGQAPNYSYNPSIPNFLGVSGGGGGSYSPNSQFDQTMSNMLMQLAGAGLFG